MHDSCKMVENQSEAFHTFLWHFFHVWNRILLHIVLLKCQIAFLKFTSKWQSGFSRMYSNCCCSCWFEAEIIKIGQSSHKRYSNNIVNFSRVYGNFKCLYKKSQEIYWMHHVCISSGFLSNFCIILFYAWIMLWYYSVFLWTVHCKYLQCTFRLATRHTSQFFVFAKLSLGLRKPSHRVFANLKNLAYYLVLEALHRNADGFKKFCTCRT